MKPKKIYLDALTMSESVPLKMGIDGSVIGNVSEVSFRDGGINVTAEIQPEVSKKLFGAYSAGDFSLAGPTPTLCNLCGPDRCDEQLIYDINCLCCRDGHVQ